MGQLAVVAALLLTCLVVELIVHAEDPAPRSGPSSPITKSRALESCHSGQPAEIPFPARATAHFRPTQAPSSVGTKVRSTHDRLCPWGRGS